MDRLTIEQCVKIIKTYYKSDDSSVATFRALRDDYGRLNRPTTQAIGKIVKKFETLIMFGCDNGRYCYMKYPSAGVFIARLCIVTSSICILISILVIVFYDTMMEVAHFSKARSEENKTAFIAFAGTLIAVHAVNTFVSCRAITGVREHSDKALLPWLAFNAILIFICVIGVFSYSLFSISIGTIFVGIYLWAWCGIAFIYKDYHAANQGDQ